MKELGQLNHFLGLEVDRTQEGIFFCQQKYAKEYRMTIHRWSYGRLIKSIKSQAAKAGIPTEIGTQPIRGSPQEKARDLAVLAYQERQVAVI